MKKKIAIVFFYFSISILGLFSFICNNMPAIGQLFPLPPPMPDTKSAQTTQGGMNDHRPPIIEILTEYLYQGKNVFKVKITDESTLRLREVKYVQNGLIKTAGLARDQNDVYKALIVAQPPSAVVVVNADDIYGNRSTSAKSFNVLAAPDIFSQLWNFFKK
jgi:hypothetical protein